MRYPDVSRLSNSKFKRMVGVTKQTFDLMLTILLNAYDENHEFGGSPSKLSLEEKLLIALSYWREYRTYAHIGMTYGYSESQVCRIVHWCENVLIKSGKFTVGGKKELLSMNTEVLILIDATESPIQRPKKNKVSIILAKRKDTR